MYLILRIVENLCRPDFSMSILPAVQDALPGSVPRNKPVSIIPRFEV